MEAPRNRRLAALHQSIAASRRHLNKGQQAMVTAMAYPEATKYKRGGSILSSGKNEDDAPSAGHISKARYVLRNNFTPEGQKYPDRCLAVMAGTLALTEAYAMTQTDVKQREEEEQQIISGFRPGGESSKTPPGQILPHHLMLQCD